jgi:hypothetical protein
MTTGMLRSSVSGLITGGRRGWPFGASMLDLAACGYIEAEYFLEGTAERRRPSAPGCWSTGRPTPPASTAP